MSNLIIIGISDFKIAKAPDMLITYALGSCIGTCLYDALLSIGGLSHILLPEAKICPGDPNLMKFADTAIEALVSSMERLGVSRSRLTAKIVGGAKMFACEGINVGERNTEAVKKELKRLNIKLVAEDTGLNYGRTVEFNPQDGTVMIKSVLHGKRSL
jgi:chemotaxis protein CheD